MSRKQIENAAWLDFAYTLHTINRLVNMVKLNKTK